MKFKYGWYILSHNIVEWQNNPAKRYYVSFFYVTITTPHKFSMKTNSVKRKLPLTTKLPRFLVYILFEIDWDMFGRWLFVEKGNKSWGLFNFIVRSGPLQHQSVIYADSASKTTLRQVPFMAYHRGPFPTAGGPPKKMEGFKSLISK